MHRTLKAETANPPYANLRQQQKSFNRFQQEYNHVRPHQALSYRKPGEVYVASAREFPRRLLELEYPPGAHLRRISQQGSLKWKTERTFVSEVLARRTVGLLETDNDLYEVYYGPIFLGWFEALSHVFIAQKRPPKSQRDRHKENETGTAERK
jgi:Integrase core domain